jgi:hypothetical protein
MEIGARQEGIMETLERVETPPLVTSHEAEQLRKQNRRLRWLSVALAAIVVAAGAWIVFDSGDSAGDSAADLTPEQEQMLETIDAYFDAWNDHDGAAAAALMASDASYHDNGVRYLVADGRLADFVTRLSTFSVASSAQDGEAAFVGNYVLTTDFIPETSTTARPSLFEMTSDGTAIVWHYAP